MVRRPSYDVLGYATGRLFPVTHSYPAPPLSEILVAKVGDHRSRGVNFVETPTGAVVSWYNVPFVRRSQTSSEEGCTMGWFVKGQDGGHDRIFSLRVLPHLTEVR